MRLPLGVVLTTLAAACALGAAGRAGAACGWSGYSYAGVQASRTASGVAARLTLVGAPKVEHGHVAAWVGLGGYGLGAGGRDAWLQVGIVAGADGGAVLYYERAFPGLAPQKVSLGPARPGSSHRVAVLETRRRGIWRVWVDGRPVSPRLYLPGSHGAWRPVATGESWDGGVPSCNEYRFRFGGVRVATRPGGGWEQLTEATVLEDPGYRVRLRSPADFLIGRV